MGYFIGIVFYTSVLLFCADIVSAITKSKWQLFWERFFTWALRLLVIPLTILTILAILTKGYNAEIAHVAYAFLTAIPFNVLLVFGWIVQEVHFYKFKQKNTAV